jgi:hypothetical protein
VRNLPDQCAQIAIHVSEPCIITDLGQTTELVTADFLAPLKPCELLSPAAHAPSDTAQCQVVQLGGGMSTRISLKVEVTEHTIRNYLSNICDRSVLSRGSSPTPLLAGHVLFLKSYW